VELQLYIANCVIYVTSHYAYSPTPFSMFGWKIASFWVTLISKGIDGQIFLSELIKIQSQSYKEFILLIHPHTHETNGCQPSSIVWINRRVKLDHWNNLTVYKFEPSKGKGNVQFNVNIKSILCSSSVFTHTSIPKQPPTLIQRPIQATVQV